jgi:23S rRNA (cytidine1920-2'-O)/16S rRNA (cytidine1409-2'-O)-methyltransferase
VAAGLVTVEGAPALKAATLVHAGQAVVVAAPPRRYVSRGGDKLAHALATFDVDPRGRRCLDAGVSTGGFTDCLLQHGAAFVVAYDVGYGQVHESLRTDPRVAVHERTNVRTLTTSEVGAPAPELLVADLSFISLASVLPTLRAVLAPVAEAIVLVKPQFEAGRGDVGKGGVVRDPTVWRAALGRVAASAATIGWEVIGASVSPLRGPAGNVEFLLHLADRPAADPAAPADPADSVATLLDHAVERGEALRRGESPAALPTGGTRHERDPVDVRDPGTRSTST